MRLKLQADLKKLSANKSVIFVSHDIDEAMQITADELKTQGLIDTVIDEPEAGAHRDKEGAAKLVGAYIVNELTDLARLSIDDILEHRMNKILSKGSYSQ